MDYHQDRFSDCSLVVEADGEWQALLPAHTDGMTLVSHAGLTYGGWIVAPSMTAPRMLQAFEATET
jgi:hypothetical protein